MSKKNVVTVQTIALSCYKAWKKCPIHKNELTARKQHWKTSSPLAMLVVRVHLATVTHQQAHGPQTRRPADIVLMVQHEAM